MYMCIRFIILYNLIAGTSQLNKHMLSSLQQTYFHCYQRMYHISSMQFAVVIILLVLPSSLLYTLQIVVSIWGCFVTCICTKDCVTFFCTTVCYCNQYQNIPTQHISGDIPHQFISDISPLYIVVYFALSIQAHVIYLIVA